MLDGAVLADSNSPCAPLTLPLTRSTQVRGRFHLTSFHFCQRSISDTAKVLISCFGDRGFIRVRFREVVDLRNERLDLRPQTGELMDLGPKRRLRWRWWRWSLLLRIVRNEFLKPRFKISTALSSPWRP